MGSEQSIIDVVGVFTSILVALSPLTILPIYFNMTESMDEARSHRLAGLAVLTASILSVTVVIVGPALFQVLAITLNDLRIGGGLVLLLLAIHDLVFSRERRKRAELSAEDGVVPLGTPLIVGPGTMTASLVLAEAHGRLLVIGALVVNMLLIWAMLYFAGRLRRWIQPSIARAFGKVMSLMLAAIAVSILRAGLKG